MPPPIDIDDHGVRWRTEGPILRIERGPSGAAVAVPVGLVLLFVAYGVAAWRDGETGSAALAVLFALIPLGYAIMRTVIRFRIDIDGTSVKWESIRPRPGTGSWSRSRIDGLRFWVDPEKGSWLSRPSVEVSLRVDGDWVTLASGLSQRRARRLVEALSLATGMAPVHDGDAQST